MAYNMAAARSALCKAQRFLWKRLGSGGAAPAGGGRGRASEQGSACALVCREAREALGSLAALTLLDLSDGNGVADEVLQELARLPRLR